MWESKGVKNSKEHVIQWSAKNIYTTWPATHNKHLINHIDINVLAQSHILQEDMRIT